MPLVVSDVTNTGGFGVLGAVAHTPESSDGKKYCWPASSHTGRRKEGCSKVLSHALMALPLDRSLDAGLNRFGGHREMKKLEAEEVEGEMMEVRGEGGKDPTDMHRHAN